MESLTSEQGLIDPLELVISITEYVGENPLIVSLLDRYFRVVGTSINESGVSVTNLMLDYLIIISMTVFHRSPTQAH